MHSIDVAAAMLSGSSPVRLCTGVARGCLPPSRGTQQQTVLASLNFDAPSAPLQDLLQLTGGIDAARPSADGYNGFERALESCRQHGLEHEVLSAEEVNKRFPGYQLPADMQVGDMPSAVFVTQGCSCLCHAARAWCLVQRRSTDASLFTTAP